MRRAEASASSLWNQDSNRDRRYTPQGIFQEISQRLPGVDIRATQDNHYGSELVERWILNPELKEKDSKGGFLHLAALQRSFFIKNLQTVINTFWDSTIGSEIRTGSLDPAFFPLKRPAWDIRTISVRQNRGPHYICHFRLAGITIAISFILLLAANLSMLLGLFTRAPDILGFVSMAARDNPHFKKHVPSHIDGKEAARILCNVRVMIGDVGGDAEAGHIALATMDAGPERLTWEKYYD